jgi:hypothetical protein
MNGNLLMSNPMKIQKVLKNNERLKLIFVFKIFYQNLEYPEHRKFHSCVRIDNYCYVFGGLYFLEYSCKSVENCVWRINLVDLKWEKLDIKMPINSYFHATCSNDVFKFYLN